MKRRSFTWLLVPLVAVLLAYVLYPCIATLVNSLHDEHGFTVRHYRDAFAGEGGVAALENSLLVSFASVLVAGAIGLPLALVFTFCDFPLRGTFAALAVLPVMLPPLVGTLSFYFLFGETGILPRALQHAFGMAAPPFSVHGLNAVVLVHGYTQYPFFYLFASAALRQLDPELLEAARGLGAGRWRAFAWVVWPLLRPALAGAALLVFMTSMASFSAPFIFATGEPILSLSIYTARQNGDEGGSLALTVVATLISIAFLVGFQRMGRAASLPAERKGVTGSRLRIRSRLGRALAATAGVIGVGWLLLPHASIVLLAFARNGTWTSQVLPPAYTLDNFAAIGRDFARAFGHGGRLEVLGPLVNSFQMTLVSLAANVVVGVMAAIVLVRHRFPGRGAVEAVLMLPWALPGTVVAMSLIAAFSKPGALTFGTSLVGSFWILPLAYFLRNLPVIARSTAAALEQVPPSLEEAARGLGASKFTALRRVVLPLV
ncbi:MAG: iron ABC transporter permease, partial [Planctomycetes bacterium]|nr:iron ABC transporter permease [Planctomycetota bacterium]